MSEKKRKSRPSTKSCHTHYHREKAGVDQRTETSEYYPQNDSNSKSPQQMLTINNNSKQSLI